MRSAYDRLAPAYDGAVGWSPQAARAKAAALAEVRRSTAPGHRLLDVGCGTGTEALLLARMGRRIVGIDVSPAMVRMAERAAAEAGADARFFCTNAADLGELGLAASSFQGAYSFFGVLDLEPRLQQALRCVSEALEPGAPFVVGLLNPTVSYELLLYPLAGRFKGYRKAFQRPVRLKTRAHGQDSVDCYLRTPTSFARLAEPWFSLEKVVGLHFLLPPPRGVLLRMRRVQRAAAHIERRLGAVWPFSRLGYFSLLTLRRKA